MARKATFDPSTKAAALYLLERGLATYQEIAELAGVSRQVVRYWAQEFPQARQEYLAELWRKATRRTAA